MILLFYHSAFQISSRCFLLYTLTRIWSYRGVFLYLWACQRPSRGVLLYLLACQKPFENMYMYIESICKYFHVYATLLIACNILFSVCESKCWYATNPLGGVVLFQFSSHRQPWGISINIVIYCKWSFGYVNAPIRMSHSSVCMLLYLMTSFIVSLRRLLYLLKCYRPFLMY